MTREKDADFFSLCVCVSFLMQIRDNMKVNEMKTDTLLIKIYTNTPVAFLVCFKCLKLDGLIEKKVKIDMMRICICIFYGVIRNK